MRRRTGILLVAAVILLAFVTVTLLRRPPDPIYNGKRLSAWLDSPRNHHGTTWDWGAVHAIPEIGTNALPLLLDWLNYEPPLSRYPIFQHLPNWILKSRPVWNLLANPRAARRAAAARDAFDVLGRPATPAVPELTRLATAKKPSARRENSILALSNILAYSDHPPIPALIAVLSAPMPQAHINLMPCLRQLGTNGHPIVPLLLQNLRQTNSYIPSINAKMLGDLRLEPDVVVPALAKCLQDLRTEMRIHAAWSLSQFGEDASGALPILTNALSDPDPDVRNYAAEAIRAISDRVRPGAPAQ